MVGNNTKHSTRYRRVMCADNKTVTIMSHCNTNLYPYTTICLNNPS